MKPAGLIARGAYDDDAERTRKTVCRQCKTVCRGIRRCLLREMLPRRRHIQVFRVLCEGYLRGRFTTLPDGLKTAVPGIQVLAGQLFLSSSHQDHCPLAAAARRCVGLVAPPCVRACVPACVPLSAPRTLLSQHGVAWQPPTIIFCARVAHLRCRMRSSCAVQERGANASQARRTHAHALGGGAGLGSGVRGCAGEQSK